MARAANVVQIKEKQISNPQPVTHQFITDILEPPNPLKYKELIKGPDKETWERGMYNKLGRLAQGYKTINGRNIIYFIYRNKVPKKKHVTYRRIVYSIRP